MSKKAKAAEAAQLRTAVNRINVRNLIDYLEDIGGNAANVLLSRDQRTERMRTEPISISPAMLDNVVAILRVRARPGRARIWSREVDGIARMGLSAGEDIRPLARRIAAMTGQTVESVRTMLQNIRKSPEFKRDLELSARFRPVRASEGFSVGGQEAARKPRGAKK
jgi:hypothetical protein